MVSLFSINPNIIMVVDGKINCGATSVSRLCLSMTWPVEVSVCDNSPSICAFCNLCVFRIPLAVLSSWMKHFMLNILSN